MQRYFFPVLLLVGTLAACNSRSEDEAVNAIASSLNRSNEILMTQNDEVYENFERRVKDYRQREKTLIWRPKALRIKEMSIGFCAYIDSIQKQVQLSDMDGKDVRHLLQKVSDSLYAKWIVYCEAVPVIDTIGLDNNPVFIKHLMDDIASIKQIFAGRCKLEMDSVTSFPTDIKQWKASFFEGETPAQVSMVLYKLKNDALAIENMMLRYFNSRSGSIFCGFNSAHSLIGLISTTRVKAGQTIEIYAGKGDFGYDASPGITIYDSTLTLGPEGTATYSFIAKGKPGKHIIPVQIEYYEPDGARASVTRNLEYIIAE